MAKILTFANHKGGVAKTTIATSLADALARDGYEVLFIDMDPQANATRLMYSFEDEPKVTLEQVLEGKVAVMQAVLTNIKVDGVHMIGSSLQLGAVQRNMSSSPFHSTSILKTKLAPIADGYDVIIIDTPPSLDLLTANALAASDFVFVPIESGSKLSLVGTDDMLAFIGAARNVNPGLQFGGAILTRHDARKKMCQFTASAVLQVYGHVLEASLPSTTEIQKAQALGQTLLQYDRDLSASKQVIAMGREVAGIASLSKQSVHQAAED